MSPVALVSAVMVHELQLTIPEPSMVALKLREPQVASCEGVISVLLHSAFRMSSAFDHGHVTT